MYYVDNKDRATKTEGGRNKDGNTLDPVAQGEKKRREAPRETECRTLKTGYALTRSGFKNVGHVLGMNVQTASPRSGVKTIGL